MTKEETEYILKNYFALMSPEKASELKRYMDVFNVKVVAKGQEDNKVLLNKLLGVYGLKESDLQQYTEEGYQVFLYEAAEEIGVRNKSAIIFNKCPVCGQLAGSPIARQGGCGHTW
ncbi:MAG: hypothetical protein ACHQRM_10755 [Bacteroidia bacterium]